MRYPARLPCRFLATLLGVVLLAGCASYSQSFRRVELRLLSNDPAGALAILDQQDHGSKDRFLYACNRGMLLRMLGRFEESNREFEKAKAILEQYAATSISEQAASFVINDASRTYLGSPVEQVMLHIYSALNYLALDDRDGARVEILQADLRLRRLMQDDPDSPLSVDPFARYLSGIVYEDLGEWSDAMIAYRKAYEAYQAHAQLYDIRLPRQLQRALIRSAARMGLDDERRRYEQAFGQHLDELPPTGDGGELVVFFHAGLAPIKRESSIDVLEPGSRHMIRVALPRYEPRPYPASQLRLRLQPALFADGPVPAREARSEKTEDIARLEIRTLESQIGAITARAIARAAAKHELARETGRQNDLAGLIVNIAGVLSERADTRSWLTLPAEIQTARLPAPAGRYRLELALLDASGNVLLQRDVGEIELAKGRKHYLSFNQASLLPVINPRPR